MYPPGGGKVPVMRHVHSLGVMAVVVLGLLSACSGASGPATPPVAPAATADVSYDLRAGEESLVAQFEVVIDPQSLTATVTPVPGRAGQAQPPQAISYDLDIANFLRPGSFEITSIRFDTAGDLLLGYIHRHPFRAPDFTAQITGQNRADLGYTGRLLVVANGTTQTYFSNTVRLDPTLVKNADGYFNPGDLLLGGSGTNNTFPYLLLADEQKNNRIGLNNAGNMTGSYAPAQGGWQRSNIGGGNLWTGYDYVHGGQELSNSMTLSRSALAATDYQFRVAVLIKYTDPRGIGGRTRRFPPDPFDVTQFAYRLPYAALDCSQITLDQESYAIDGTTNAVVGVGTQIRDWDATATEAGDADLSDETDVTLIEPGAAGPPVVEVSAPFLHNGTFSFTQQGSNSGHPNDELEFTGTLINSLGSASSGDYFALLRAVDPGDNNNVSVYHKGVDPTTIIPDPARVTRRVTYQAIPITVEDLLQPPNITAVSPTGNVGCASQVLSFSATNTGGPVDTWSWNFGGGATPNTSGAESPSVTLSATPNTYNGSVTATNAAGSSGPFNFVFTIQTPWASHVIAPTVGSQNRGWVPRVTLFDGKPVIVSIETNPVSSLPSTSTVLVSYTTNPDPNVTADWTSYPLVTFPDNGLWSSADIGVYNGRLVISHTHIITTGSPYPFTSELRIAIANSTALPTSAGDWTIHTIEGNTAGRAFGRDSKIVVHNGLLAISAWEMTDLIHDLRISQATTPNPTGPADWMTHVPEGPNLTGIWTGMISFNDGVSPRLMASYWDATVFQLRCARALTLTPASAGDWAFHSIDTAGASRAGRWSAICQTIRAGQPRAAISYSWVNSTQSIFQAKVAIANTAAPVSETDWTMISLATISDFSGSWGAWGTDIIQHNGALAVAWNQNDQLLGQVRLGFARAITDNPTGPASFQVSYPLTTLNTGYYPRMVTLDSGNLGITYRQGQNFLSTPGALEFVKRTCPLP